MSDLIYLDLQTKNIFNTGTSKNQVELKDDRNTPFIKKASDYKMSVIRFQCDTNFLPVFLTTIEPDQPNPNLTIYSVTLSYGNSIIQKPIIWENEMQSSIPIGPSSLPNGVQQTNTNYYYALNYQHFIKLINKALKSAMDDLKILQPALIGTEEPYLFWNTTNLTAELVAPVSFFDTEIVNHVSIFFNIALYALFSSFSGKEFYLNAGRDFKLMLESNNQSNVEGTKVILKQNYSTIACWSPISSIIFASTILPINPTNVSTPLIQKNGMTIPGFGANNSTINVISDISVNQQSYKPNILYNPTAEYRFIDLMSSGEISNVNILVFWKGTNGEFFPLQLSSGGSASIKLLFQKK
jgi:hypothetical protein